MLRRLLSTTPKWRNLSSILKEEMDYEVKNNTIHTVHPHTVDFLKSKGWEISHTLGKSEIKIEKNVDEYKLEMFIDGNENIDPEAEEGTSVVLDVTRKGQEGIVTMDLNVDGGELNVVNTCYYPSLEYQKKDNLREDNYEGPSMATLDEKVEEELHLKLESLSVGKELADKIRDLKIWKEQVEYENWLDKVGNFFK
eukprot:NODE_10_length_61504_cov_0.956502.p36 type:complete len:196 gc:universal NODE_10_length_61504_cov_0.956502:34681-34094(-)